MINRKLEWTSSDASAWKNFLQTQTGIRLLEQIASAKPVLLGAGETNSILIRCGEARNHDDVTSTIIDLAGGALEAPKSDPTQAAYPSLEDDRAWGDGQSVNPKTQQD
jgi:hypothetical protein